MTPNDIITWLRDKLPYAPDHAWKNVMSAAADKLEELEEQNRWIAVTEELPESGHLVLAVDIDGVMSVAYYVGRWHGLTTEDEPVCWRPLPKAPKEVQK